MSFFDSAKEKAQEFADSNPDKVEELSDQGLDRAGDLADGATGGRFSDQINQGRDAADERIGNQDSGEENPA